MTFYESECLLVTRDNVLLQVPYKNLHPYLPPNNELLIMLFFGGVYWRCCWDTKRLVWQPITGGGMPMPVRNCDR